MRIDEASEFLSSLSIERKARMLVEVSYQITVVARDTYETQSHGLKKPERMRSMNEIQHRVLGAARDLLRSGVTTFPDEVLAGIFFDEREDGGLRHLLEFSFEQAMKQESTAG